jgi:hypothetical protein
MHRLIKSSFWSIGRQALVVISIGFWSFSACEQERVSVNKLLHRSGHGPWETRVSYAVGVQLDLPKDRCRFLDDRVLGMQAR